MSKAIRTIFVVVIALFALLALMQSLSTSNSVNPLEATRLPNAAATAIDLYSTAPAVGGDIGPLRDNSDLYKYDDPGSVVTIFVTVRRGNSSDNTNHTWREINDLTRYNFGPPGRSVAKIKVDAIVQFGDDTGPLSDGIGYGAYVPNATIELRGDTSPIVSQPSYKITLSKKAGLWRGQSIINLNKHLGDDTRVRNKLNFDLLEQIPDITSLRTQFVHLYVMDQTMDLWGETFVDYGLYTQVEQPNTDFLRAHLLDKDAQLYKANAFDFHRYPDHIRLETDPLFTEAAFSAILEIKGNRDNSKLIAMLDDVNSYDVPIEITFEKYFDPDNYFTWLAYNILVGNSSTANQNYFLYSPHNGSDWYFLPWDYDSSFPLLANTNMGMARAPWAYGISNYWDAVLPNRLLREERFRRALDEKINMVMGILTPTKIRGILDSYRPAVDLYVSRMPDLENLQRTLKSRDLEFGLLPGDIQANYGLYLISLTKPMPFHLKPVKDSNEEIILSWEAAYDLSGQNVTYEFALATDWAFENVLAKYQLTDSTEVQFKMPEPGTYFWRVVARNSSGGTQVPYEYYEDANSTLHYGVKYLYITPDGKILEK